MRVYIDLETYRKNVFTEEKIIAIGLIEDNTGYSPSSTSIWSGEEVRFIYFTEWDLGGEEAVVKKFYNYLYNVASLSRFVVVVGFNILRFDIPLLIEKGIEYNVGDISELNRIWYNTFTIDYLQVSLPLNNMRFRELNLNYLVDYAKRRGIEIPYTYMSGADIKNLYENKEYGRIIEHLTRDLKIIRIIDLNFRKLFLT